MANNNNNTRPYFRPRPRTPRFRSIHRLAPFLRPDSSENIFPLRVTQPPSEIMEPLTTRRVCRPEEFNFSDFYDSEAAGVSPGDREIHGKYRTILWGRFVLGPGWIKLSITIGISLGLLVLLILQHPAIDKFYGCVPPYMFYLLWSGCLMLIFATALRDPGILPRNVGYADHCLKYPRNMLRELGLPSHYCEKCSIRRPPRTYHCFICNICIRYQDIHLGMLGTCIGERNFRYYWLLNLYLVTLAIILGSYNAIILCVAGTGRRKHGVELWDLHSVLALCLILIAISILFLPQLGLPAFLYRFYLIAKDRTLREEFRALMLGNIAEIDRTYIKKSYCYKLHEFIFPIPTTQSYFANRNQTSQQRGSRIYPPWGVGIGHSEQHLLEDISRLQGNEENSRKRSHPTDLFGNTSSAKRKAFYSLPMLHDGEVGKLPSTRPRRHRRSRPKDTIASKLVLYQELLETPKSVVDQQVHQHQNFNASLSLGDMPRATWNQSTENEIVYQARANQIQRVVHLVQRRDRRGLISLGHRVNIGGLMGVQMENPDNLQIIELNNNATPLLGGRRTNRGARQPNRGVVGISQLVAAGYMSRLDGSIVREMVPPVLPPIPTNPVRAAISPDHLRRLQAQLIRAGSFLPNARNNLNLSIGQSLGHSPAASNNARSNMINFTSRRRQVNMTRPELNRAGVVVVGPRLERAAAVQPASEANPSQPRGRGRSRSRSRSATRRNAIRNTHNI